MTERCKCCGQILPPEELPEGIKLSAIKQQIWQAVTAFPGMSSFEIMDWVYGHRDDGGPESRNLVRVHIVAMNKQLKQHGLEIRGDKTDGYRVKTI